MGKKEKGAEMSLYSEIYFIISGLLNKNPFVLKKILELIIDMKVQYSYKLVLKQDEIERIADSFLKNANMSEIESSINLNNNASLLDISDKEFLLSLGIILNEEK